MKLTKRSIEVLERKMQANQMQENSGEPIRLWESTIRCSECGAFLTPRKARNWALKNGFTLEEVKQNPELVERHQKFCSPECARTEAEIRRWRRVLFGRR